MDIKFVANGLRTKELEHFEVIDINGSLMEIDDKKGQGGEHASTPSIRLGYAQHIKA